MPVQTPLAVVMTVGGTVAGLLLGVLVGRQSTSPRPAVTSEARAAQAVSAPASASAAMTPVPAAAPHQPRVVAPTESDAIDALRISRMSDAERASALCVVERQANPDITFAALERNAARFDTQVAVFRGKVLEIQDIPNDGGSFLRLGLDSYGQRVIAVFTYLTPPDTVVRGRRVKVYGRMANTYSYTSQAGWNITIPRLNAVAVVGDADAPRCPRQ